MGHQHMLNSIQLSVGLGHRHDPQELWPAGLGHRHKPCKHSTLHATQTLPHTSRSPPERHPCSAQTSAATTCNFLFFYFCFLRKKQKKKKMKKLLVTVERRMPNHHARKCPMSPSGRTRCWKRRRQRPKKGWIFIRIFKGR